MDKIIRSFRWFALLVLTIVCLAGTTHAQSTAPADTQQTIPVVMGVRGVGIAEFEVISKAGKTYLPLLTIFKFLQLKAEYNPGTGPVEGFIINLENRYRIEPSTGRAQIRDTIKTITARDYILTPSEFYLRQELFESFFRLKLEYQPRRVAVKLSTKLKLPVFLAREREFARMRQKLLYKLPDTDVTMPRIPILLGGGRLDWNLNAFSSTTGPPRYDYSFRLGNQLLGGNLETNLHGTINRPLTLDNITSRLQYAFLGQRWLNQVILGDMLSGSIIPASIIGAEITNRPAPRRLIFTEDIFSDFVGPNQTVDLYRRSSLTESQVTAPTGEYNFTSVLNYGVSTFEVKAYDQFGVERVFQYRIDVPSTMVPPGEIQYSLSSGINRFRHNLGAGNFSLLWGLSSRLTVGYGLDYVNVQRFTQKFYPYISSIARITNLMDIQLMGAPAAVSQATLSMFYPSALGGTLSYTHYARNPFYNPFQAENEKSLSFNLPISQFFNLYNILNFNFFGRQVNYVKDRRWDIRGSFTFSILPFSIRLLEMLSWEEHITTDTIKDIEYYAGPKALTGHRTSITVSTYLPASFSIRATTYYDHLTQKFLDLRIALTKRFPPALQINLFYDRSFLAKFSTIGLQIVYYFPFAVARAGVSHVGGDGNYTFSQGVRGSLGYSDETNDFVFDYLSRVGTGGVAARPFLDLNGNSVQDPGEEDITKARLNSATMIGGGTRLKYIPGVGFGITRALPYEEYAISIDPASLENPLWVPQFNSFSVITEPDRFQVVDIPIVVGGIVRGAVQELVDDVLKPIEGLTVKIESEDKVNDKSRFVKSMQTFSTGE